jgi:putative ABC transport system permease protein
MSKDIHQPPAILRILSFFIDKNKAALLESNFEEIYDRLYRHEGKRAARKWFWTQFLSSIPYLVQRSVYWRMTMFKNHIKISVRKMRKQKIFTLINTGGLTLGMSCVLLIGLWVKNELSFDRFHNEREKIYRITMQGIHQGTQFSDIGTPAPLAPVILEELPEAEHAARIRYFPRLIFKHAGRAFYEDRGFAVDPSFFKIFNFRFVSGDPGTALSDLFSIVLTEETARKYFGPEDPVGKPIEIEGRFSFIVTGVIENIPHNSSLTFDYLTSYQCVEAFDICGTGWGDPNFWTYVKLKQACNENEIGKKITKIAGNHGCPHVLRYNTKFSVQPLKKAYLHPIGQYDYVRGNINSVYIFSVIGLFILLIACINFINLSTAVYGKRAKEIGLRKVVGASRNQIVKQFLGESYFLVCVSFILALILVRLILPHFNNMTGRNLTLNFLDINIYLAFLICTCVTALVAGLYPSFMMSSFNPADVIRGTGSFFPVYGKLRASVKGKSFRNVLVVIQFSISIILIICTIVVYNQLRYISNNGWKTEGDCIIHIPVKENIGTKYDTIKEQLINHPQITGVTVKDCLPTTLLNRTGEISWEGMSGDEERIVMEVTRIGYDYFKTLDIEIVKGRNFSRERRTDHTAYILNEQAVHQMGMRDPVGKEFSLYGRKGPIIGIARDTQFQSFKLQHPPQIVQLLTNIPEQAPEGAVFIRVKTDDSQNTGQVITAALSHIKSMWNEVNSTAPFEYHFLDETIESQYKNEQYLRSLFGTFTLLAIIISCIGLFGLSLYTSECRTKEIGIRKVLGASVSGITIMLTREFIRWVLIANVIAWPVAYYAMSRWLQGYAYRTGIGLWPFLFSGIIALVIALITVNVQSLKAAMTNPVESLKHE